MKFSSNLRITSSLFLLGVLSRIFLIEKFQSHWDGPLYSIAVLKYNLLQNTPPVPGYPIYIGIGKFFNIFIHDPHMALLIVSVLFSGIGAVCIYYFGKVVVNQKVGVIAALLLLSSPSFYYFGITTYAYVGLPTFVSLIGIYSYKIFVKKENAFFLFSVFIGLNLAYRPQDLFFITPLFLIILFMANLKNALISLATIFFISISWLVPVGRTIGGISNYLDLVRSGAAGGTFVSLKLIQQGFLYDLLVLRIIRGIYLTLGIGIPFLIIGAYKEYFRKKPSKDLIRKVAFFSFLMLPALIFHITLRIEHAGYQFNYLVPLLVLTAASISSIAKKRRNILISLIGLIVIFNLYTFFRNRDSLYSKPYSPSSFHYSEIAKNDYKFEQKTNYIKKNFNPATTVIIIGTPEMFTPVAYHFSKYRIFQFDGLITLDKRFINISRFSYYLKLSTRNSDKHVFTVPRGIEKIVFIDDESKNWNIYGMKSISLGKNTYVGILSVYHGEPFIYSYHVFKRI